MKFRPILRSCTPEWGKIPKQPSVAGLIPGVHSFDVLGTPEVPLFAFILGVSVLKLNNRKKGALLRGYPHVDSI